MAKTDIDIDFPDRDAALAGLYSVPAMQTNKNGDISRHAAGVYFQPAPINPITGLCAFDYHEAQERGYFKVDFLNQTVYRRVTDEAHLDRLIERDPPWELLSEPEFVKQLTHIHAHFDVVQSVQPQCIEDLAVVLALIRPGKRYLVGKPRSRIDHEVWTMKDGDDSSYQFKRAHAISYAALIVVQMNLIVEQLTADIENGDSDLIHF